MDHVEHDCREVSGLLSQEFVKPCPDNDCGPQLVNGRLRPLTTDPNTGQLVYGHWERVDITVNGEKTRGKPHFVVDRKPLTIDGRFILGIGFGFGLDPPQNPTSRSDVSSLMDGILKLFKDHPNCEGSMNQLLGELKTSTGYDAGSIKDVIEAFRANGIAYADERAAEPGATGGGSAGTGIGGVPSIAFSQGSTPEWTAITVMGEMMHWAGMPKQGGGYANYYTDTAMANAWNKLGVVMSVEQYRHSYPEQVATDTKRWGYDYAESRLAHGGINVGCLGIVTGLVPKYVKP